MKGWKRFPRYRRVARTRARERLNTVFPFHPFTPHSWAAHLRRWPAPLRAIEDPMLMKATQ